jgi:hypothetical protein
MFTEVQDVSSFVLVQNAISTSTLQSQYMHLHTHTHTYIYILAGVPGVAHVIILK